MKPQLFIDLDGVLADFDGFYESNFGIRPARTSQDLPDMWDNIKNHGTFYLDLPMMGDALRLWHGACILHPKPVILTGLPYSITDVEIHKRRWVSKYIGRHAEVICCASKDKCKFGKPGDILVDDWEKYRHLWEGMGGAFVLHTSAEKSLDRIQELLNGH